MRANMQPSSGSLPPHALSAETGQTNLPADELSEKAGLAMQPVKLTSESGSHFLWKFSCGGSTQGVISSAVITCS